MSDDGCFWTDYVGVVEDCSGPTPPDPEPTYLAAEADFQLYVDIFNTQPHTSHGVAVSDLDNSQTYSITAFYIVADTDGCHQSFGKVSSAVSWWPTDFQTNYGDMPLPGGVGHVVQLSSASVPLLMGQTWNANGMPGAGNIVSMESLYGAASDFTTATNTDIVVYLRLERADGELYYAACAWNGCH